MDVATLEPTKRTTPADLSGNIWLCQCHWRQELALVRDCAERSIPAYAPQQRIKRWYPRLREWREWDALIFQWYVFVGDCGRPEADVFYDIMDTGRIQREADNAGVRMIADQTRIRRELENFEILHKAGLGWTLQRIATFKRGDMSRVAAGPLQGLTGEVIQCPDKRHRMIVELTVIGRKRAVEIDCENLEAMGANEQ